MVQQNRCPGSQFRPRVAEILVAVEVIALAINASTAISQRTGKTEDLGSFFVQFHAGLPLSRWRGRCTNRSRRSSASLQPRRRLSRHGGSRRRSSPPIVAREQRSTRRRGEQLQHVHIRQGFRSVVQHVYVVRVSI